MSSRKIDLLVFLVVALAASVVQAASMRLIIVPVHDELAYVWNPLYFSGHVNNSTNIAWVERPPLFWWGLTYLMILGASPSVMLYVSPLFAVLLAILLTQFTKELTGDVRAGLVAGLITGLSGFVGAAGARVLTDAMGTFFAALSVYAFYKYFIDKNPNQSGTRMQYAALWGVSLALSLIARDENLTLIPIFALIWIFGVSKAKIRRKLLYAILFFAIFGGPIAFLGLADALQLASNILTPFVLGGWWAIILILASLSYIAHKAKTVWLRDYTIASLGFFMLMLPFYFDNYVIANIDYYVTGKGILSRPISHVLMLPITSGVGANLSITARFESWISTIPLLITPAVFLLAAAGLFFVARGRRDLFILLFFWLGISLGYVVLGTNLENRFLLIAFPSLCICAAFGFTFLWKLNRWLAILGSVVTLVLVDMAPISQFSLGNEVLVLGFTSKNVLWFYQYVESLGVGPSTGLRLSLASLADGVLGLAIPILVLFLIITTSLFPGISRRFAKPRKGETIGITVASGMPESPGPIESVPVNSIPQPADVPSPQLRQTSAPESGNSPQVSAPRVSMGQEMTAHPSQDPITTTMPSSAPAIPVVLASTPVRANYATEKKNVTDNRRSETVASSSLSSYLKPTINSGKNSTSIKPVQQPVSPRQETKQKIFEAPNEARKVVSSPSTSASKETSSPKTQSTTPVLMPNSKFFKSEPKAKTEPKFCPKCGAEVRGAICTSCGAQIA